MKYIALLTLTTVLVACSHSSPKKTMNWHSAHMHKVKFPWYGMGPMKMDKRKPASVSGDLKAFAAALKANNGWKEELVGYEVVRITVDSTPGQEGSTTETNVFLKNTKYGSIALVQYSGDGIASLEASETTDDVDYLLEQMQRGSVLTSVKKLSNTTFDITMNIKGEGFSDTCIITMDVSKSISLMPQTCTDEQGHKSVTTVKSVTKVDLKKYVDQLKSIKMEVTPLVLDEYEMAQSVTDETEKDWSFLIK